MSMESRNCLNNDKYLYKKRLVISMICVSSLTTNISELKYVLTNKKNGFYVLLICLIAISMTLQVSKYYNYFIK